MALRAVAEFSVPAQLKARVAPHQCCAMEVVLKATNKWAGTWMEKEPNMACTPPCISFTSKCGSVQFVPEQGASVDEWETLALGCEFGKFASIDWDPDNGEASIYVNASGTVDFTVAKYGDGRLVLRLKAAGCAAAFHEAAAITSAWRDKAK